MKKDRVLIRGGGFGKIYTAARVGKTSGSAANDGVSLLTLVVAGAFPEVKTIDRIDDFLKDAVPGGLNSPYVSKTVTYTQKEP